MPTKHTHDDDFVSPGKDPSGKIQSDNVYAEQRAQVSPFEFNKDVVRVFPDMIERSVPGYRAVLDMTKVVASEFVQPNTIIYDLGCSLGATTRAIIEGIAGMPGVHSHRIVAIDNAPAMIEQCRLDLPRSNSSLEIDLRLGDILEEPIQNASLVALNYTLQFIPLKNRLALLTRICDGLIPGGALILSEKVVFSNSTHQDVLTSLHHDFKRMNGYSDLEVSQKRTALENVLIPEPIDIHQDRLERAGFSTNMVWFQSLNFVSMLAIK